MQVWTLNGYAPGFAKDLSVWVGPGYDMSMSLESEERRGVERYATWFPVRIIADALSGSALARNVSETGMLVATRKRFAVGDPVEIALLIEPTGSPSSRAMRGTIVRSGPNEEDPGGLWPFKVAITFSEPNPAVVPRMTDDG